MANETSFATVGVLDGDSYLYLLDSDFSVLWRMKILVDVDRVTVGRLRQGVGFVAFWLYGGETIYVYDEYGEYIGERTLSSRSLVDAYPCWGYIVLTYEYLGYRVYAYDPIEDELISLSCGDAPPVFWDGKMYQIDFWRIFEFTNVSSGRYYEIVNYDVDLWTSAYGERIGDLDGDGYAELLIWNSTHAGLVDIVNSTHARLNEKTLSLGDSLVVPGYVVSVFGDRVRFYDKFLVEVASVDAYNCSRLLAYGDGSFLAYGSRGEAYHIYSPATFYRVFINAGWSASFRNDRFVIYNAYRLEEYFAVGSSRYSFDRYIRFAMPISDGFVVFWIDGFSVYINGSKVMDSSLILDNVTSVDYDPVNGRLGVLLDNATFLFISSSGVSRFTPSSSGVVKPCCVRYGLGSFFVVYVEVKKPDADTVIASLLVYRDASLFYNTSSIFTTDPSDQFENATIEYYDASLWIYDYDFDSVEEIGSALYVSFRPTNTNSITNRYIFTVNDTNGVSCSYNGSEESIDKPAYMDVHRFGVFHMYDSFMFMFPRGSGFFRVSRDGLTDTIDLNGTEVWGSDGVLISGLEMNFVNSRGQTLIPSGGSKTRGVSSYGEYTRAIIYFGDNYSIFSINVTEDIYGPSVSIVSPADGSVVNCSRVVVSWNVSDDTGIASVSLRLDGGLWIDVSGLDSYVFYNVSEGNHTVEIIATDVANKSSSANISFIVDIPLDLDVSFPYNNSWVNTSSIEISYFSYGSVDNISIYANGSQMYFDNSTLNGTATINLSDGFWVITIVARGNIYDIVYERVYVHIDATPPNISVLYPSNCSMLNLNDSFLLEVPISFSDNFDVDHIEYRVNGSDWVNIGLSNKVYLYLGSEGYYIVEFRVYDLAGNANYTRVVFGVDAPATFNAYSPIDNVWTNSTDFLFTWNSTHIDYVLLYINNNLTDVLPSSGYWILNLGEGIWNITLVAVGFNDVITRTLWAKIDLTPPSIAVLEPENNTVFYVNDTYVEFMLRLNVTDNVGVDRIVLMYGNTTINISEEASIIVMVGNYTFHIVAYDKAGNRAETTLIISVVKEKQQEESEETSGGENETQTPTQPQTPSSEFPMDAVIVGIIVVAGAIVFAMRKKGLEILRKIAEKLHR